MALFAGLERAYGTYKVTGDKDGKQVGEALTLVDPVTEKLWQGHLDGVKGIGIVPIRDDSTALFGAIDIDSYKGLDYRKVIGLARQLKFPLVPCRSKSGGLHLYLFSDKPVAAGELRDRLSSMAASLGFGGSEVFPKQARIIAERNDIGSWINMPYFNAAQTNRPGLDDEGQPLDLAAFLDRAEALRCDVAALAELDAASAGDLTDGPPCLQILLSQGVEPGMRNDVLFNLAVYLKRARGRTWRQDIEELNQRRFKPPLPPKEVGGSLRGIGRRDYLYTCSRPAFKARCDKGACRLRKFGVGQGSDFPLLTNLQKFDTQPPTWFVDVEGAGRVELGTEDLQAQGGFQRRCMDCVNIMPPAIKPEQWRTVIQTLLESLVVVQLPHDASVVGQMRDMLESFCTSRAQAKTKEEVLLGKPWLSEGRHYFRLADFMAYLDRHHFRELKVHKVAKALKDQKAESLFLRISKKGVNLWSVPEFERKDDEPAKLPDLGEGAPI